MIKPVKGQLIYAEAQGKRKAENLTITNVGKVWFYTGVERYRLSTWRAEHSGRQAWPSRDAFDADQQLKQAWALLRGHINAKFSVPNDINVIEICKALCALRMGDRRIYLHSDVTAYQFVSNTS